VTGWALTWTSVEGPQERGLGDGPVTIGRAEECEVVLADRAMSRRHAKLVRENGEWWLEDLGSRGGTWLNGRELAGRTRLSAGDRIGVGMSLLLVGRAGESARSSASGPLQPGTSIFRRADELISGAREREATTEDLPALRRRAARLELLNDVHAALGRSLSLDELLELILDRAFRALEPEEGVIVLRDGPGEYRRAASRRPPGSMGDALLSKTLLEEVVEKRQAALVCDIAADERFGQAVSLRMSGVRSLIAAPLYDDLGPLGMLSLDSRAFERPFTEDDLELLTSLAAVAALRIRNVALAEEAAERRRLEQELKLARTIQIGLLPRSLPSPAGWSVYGSSAPSRIVSGDYYLVAERGPERAGGRELVAMIVDVSGKGMAAALLTASLEALAAGPVEAGDAPEQIFSTVSRLLYRRTLPSKYATAFLAALDPESGRLRFANAGHNPALVVRAAGGIERLAATGRPLALLADSAYRADERTVAPGDLLVLYTDGFVEASTAAGDEYGLERLEAALLGARGAPLGEVAATLERDLAGFVGDEPYADDRTLVLLRRER
jgi:serine phosphatase RsbU (regulator of sigma subunit)